MLDGTIDGYESYEAAVDAQPAEPLRRPDRRDRHALLVGDDRAARRASPGRSSPSRWRRTRSASPACCSCCSASAETSVYLSPAPLYHAAPLRFSMSIIALGGTVVVMEHFDAEQYLALVERYHVTHSQVVPTMFVRMLKLPEDVRAPLRRVVAAVRDPRRRAVPDPRQAADDRVVGPGDPRVLRGHRGQRLRVLQQRAVAGPPGHRRRRRSGACCTSSARTARRSRPARPARSTSRAGRRSSTTTTPRRRRARATRKGWSTLGDVGYLDADGFLYLTDRKAYMIISGGVNIYPQEAENVLVTHPKVVDVAVFGVPNDDFGEEVKAVVQPVDMPADAGRGRRAGPGADRVLPLAAGRRQVPPLDRLPRGAPPPPDGQALQAAPQGRVLGGRWSLDLSTSEVPR